MPVVYTTEKAPALSVPLINGDTFTLVERNPKHFTVVIFYRGAHCPLCFRYVKEIEENYQKALDGGFEIVLVSMDTLAKATQFAQDIADSIGAPSLQVPIAYGLTEEQARSWGLYISNNKEGSNEPKVFSEPGLYVVRPDTTVVVAMVQSTPFTRPSIPDLISGLQYILDNNYPIRGSLTRIK
jgi:peroxiredoxin